MITPLPTHAAGSSVVFKDSTQEDWGKRGSCFSQHVLPSRLGLECSQPSLVGRRAFDAWMHEELRVFPPLTCCHPTSRADKNIIPQLSRWKVALWCSTLTLKVVKLSGRLHEHITFLFFLFFSFPPFVRHDLQSFDNNSIKQTLNFTFEWGQAELMRFWCVMTRSASTAAFESASALIFIGCCLLLYVFDF